MRERIPGFDSEPKPRKIKDRVYGEVSYTEDDLRLFQTSAMTRLKGVTLDAMPASFLPNGVNASRFEHSVGVQHLAKIVTKKPEFADQAREIEIAALFHDAGHPPFTHTSEPFQKAVFGVAHEDFINVVFENDHLRRTIGEQADVHQVALYIKGKDEPFSNIVSGSLDVDNLDNLVRWQLASGIARGKNYSPERLAEAMVLHDGQVMLQGDISRNLNEWKISRSRAYDYLLEPAHLAPAAMLQRALHLAYQEDVLQPEFFFLTDAGAQQYLKDNADTRTNGILNRAEKWDYYNRAYTLETEAPSDVFIATMGNSMRNGEIADDISKTFGIEPENIAVDLTKNNGRREILLPLLSDSGEVSWDIPRGNQRWHANVFVAPEVLNKASSLQGDIAEYMDDKLQVA